MNNQPTIEAYKSFYQQAKDFYAAGDIPAAREAFLRAAELANRISTGAKSYDVRMEYHRLAEKILDFVRRNCSGKKPVASAAGEDNGTPPTEEKPTFAPITADDGNKVTFADVAGLEDVKEQILFRVLSPMQKPELAEKYKIKAGGKILLYGPPGTGKTFIARAIAGEVDAVFFAVNCQDLISKYMGDSSRQLDALFAEAAKYDRAIIFFDEFDSVASKRGDGTGGVDAEMARFVATFLTKVDGFKPTANKMLLLIAATNRPWTLDSAMLRGGRFDTQIYVGVPDQTAREFLVRRALGDIAREADVDLSKLAWALEGYGGGDVTAICEKIKLEPYKREVRTGSPQAITNEDCARILSAARNVITPEELEKFKAYREGNYGL